MQLLMKYEPSGMIKVVLDTNWWISFIVSKQAGDLPRFFFHDTLFCFSNELTLEIRTVLQYGHIAKRINNQNLNAYLFFEQHIAVFFPVKNDVTVCRDKKDNFLLSLSRDATADYLITRDEDLLILKQFGKTRIV